jgi:deazaflavin-dependent oxidoreductase (nitroreductase family)
MSFNTRNGTRGARQPGRSMLWINRLTAGRIRKSGHAMGFSALVLTTIGRKSGAERQSPVSCFPEDDGSWLIVASANGAAKNPAWYYNLAAHPDRVRVETAGRQVDVTAHELHDAERTAAWLRITTAGPRFAAYQKKTDRQLPVIRLVPRAG